MRSFSGSDIVLKVLGLLLIVAADWLKQKNGSLQLPQLVGDIIENIGEIVHVEEKITKYEISK